MKEGIQKQLWNTAGMAGLALGFVSIAYLAFGQLISMNQMNQPPTLTIKIISTLVWIAKFVICIMLMKFFMNKFYTEAKSITRKEVFRMGMASAFLSALVFSTGYYANMIYISPEYYDAIFTTELEKIEPLMNSNTKAKVSDILASLPKLTFFGNIIYCFLYGTVVSAILSSSITEKGDPTIEE